MSRMLFGGHCELNNVELFDRFDDHPSFQFKYYSSDYFLDLNPVFFFIDALNELFVLRWML
jgi:hypothetical protein